MGIIRQGILGGFSGKVANVVGSSWKGIAVMKSLPLSVANPRTAPQVAQRLKFSNTVAFALVILGTVIKPLWDRFAQSMSGFNAFVSENIDLFAASAIPGVLANLVISKGRMQATAISNLTAASGTQLKVDWADDSGQGFKLASDTPFLVVINETTEEVEGYDLSTVARDDTTATITVPGATGTDDYSVYLAFRRADGTVVSNTAYERITA